MTIQPLRTVDFYTIIKTIHWFNYSFSNIVFTHYAIIQYLVLWLAFVNLTQTEVIWEEETSVKDLSPTDWRVGIYVGYFLHL